MNRLMGKPVTGAPVAGRGRPVTGFGIGVLPVQEGGTISLIKSADSYLVPPTFGVTYSLLFRNNTGSTITNIVITDDIDDAKSTYVNASGTTDQGSVTVNTGFIEVTIPSLADGEVANISYQATADSVGNIINTATYTYTEGDPGSSNPVTVVCDVLPSFSIVKSSVPTDFLNPSDPVNYQAVITNNGGQAVGCVYTDPVETTKVDFATNSVITTKGTVESGNGPLDTEVRVQIGSMANGESVTITYQVLVEAGVTVPTTLTNQATVSADNAIPENSNQVVLPIYAVPTYSPTKSADSTDKSEGDRISYDVQIDTTGNTPTKNLVGIDDLHPNVTLDHTQTTTSAGSIISGDNPGDSSIQIDFSDVAADTIINVHYEVVIDDPWIGTINNTMDFTADNRAPFSTNNVMVTVVARVPDMSGAKSADTGSANPDQVITYTVDLLNSGDRDGLGVSFVDLISDVGITLVPSSVIAPGGTIVSDTGTVRVDYSSLASGGGTVQLTYQCQVENPFPGGVPGSVANFGTISGSNFTSVNTNTEIVSIAATPVPAWSLTKAADALTPTVGDTVGFTFTVENTGGAAATNVVIDDTLPVEFTNLQNPISTHGTPVINGNQITLSLANFPQGQTTTITFDADCDSAGTPSNAYSVDCDELAPTVSNTLNFTISPIPVPEWTLLKSVDTATADVGDTIHFTLSVQNTGSAQATSVVVTDVVAAEFGNFQNLTSTQGTPSFLGNTLTLNLATFPVSQTTTIEFDADVLSSGTPANSFTVDSAELIQASSNTINFTLSDTYSATLVKSSNIVGDANPGDTATYTVDLTKTGSGNLTSVVVSDEISDANLDLVPGSASTDQGVVTQDDTRIEIAVGTLTATPVQISYQATINVGMSVPGQVQNLANLASTQIPSQNSNTVNINVIAAPVPAWDLLKSVDVSTIDVGDTVHFTLRAENTGNATATNIVLEDVVPANFGNIRNETTTAGSVGVVGNTVTANIASGTAGTVITVEFDADAVSSGTPANFFTANCDEIGQATSNSTAFNISDTYSATVVKSSNVVGDANPGDTVTYTVDLTKTGSGNITSVVLADEISDADLTLVNGSATTDQGSVTQDDTRVEINVGTLGATPVQVTYQALINAGMTVPGTVSNFATLTSTQIASQNSNTVNVSVVASGGGPTLVEFPNPSFEVDVLAPGAEQNPANNWSGVKAWNPNDGIAASDGTNVGIVNAGAQYPYHISTNPESALAVDTTYKISMKVRHPNSTPNSVASIYPWCRVGVLRSDVAGGRQETNSAESDYGLIVSYHAFEAGSSGDFRVELYNQWGGADNYIVDDLIVEKIETWHPAVLNAETSGGRRVGFSFQATPDRIGYIEGIKAVPTPAGTVPAVVLAINGNSTQEYAWTQTNATQRALFNADNSLTFDGNDDHHVLAVAKTVVVAGNPWTLVIRIQVDSSGTIMYSSDSDSRLSVSGNGDLTWTGGGTNVLYANYMATYTGVDHVITVANNADGTGTIRFDQGADQPISIAASSVILASIGRYNTCFGGKLWGFFFYAGVDPTTEANAYNYLSNL